MGKFSLLVIVIIVQWRISLSSDLWIEAFDCKDQDFIRNLSTVIDYKRASDIKLFLFTLEEEPHLRYFFRAVSSIKCK